MFLMIEKGFVFGMWLETHVGLPVTQKVCQRGHQPATIAHHSGQYEGHSAIAILPRGVMDIAHHSIIPWADDSI